MSSTALVLRIVDQAQGDKVQSVVTVLSDFHVMID